MTLADKDLRKYAIEEKSWKMLKDTIGVLECFKCATDHAARHKHPTIYSAVLIYNFLLDKLEDSNTKFKKSNILHIAVTAAIKKLQTYYSKMDALIYYISTDK